MYFVIINVTVGDGGAGEADVVFGADGFEDLVDDIVGVLSAVDDVVGPSVSHTAVEHFLVDRPLYDMRVGHVVIIVVVAIVVVEITVIIVSIIRVSIKVFVFRVRSKLVARTRRGGRVVQIGLRLQSLGTGGSTNRRIIIIIVVGSNGGKSHVWRLLAVDGSVCVSSVPEGPNVPRAEYWDIIELPLVDKLRFEALAACDLAVMSEELDIAGDGCTVEGNGSHYC